MKKKILIIFLTLSNIVFGQDFLMQGWYWDYPKTPDGYNWADTLTNKAQELADAGFTYIWLPPLSRASFGNSSNGYDPQDLFDLGETYGGGATGFGSRNDLDNLVTEFNTVGINAVADVIYNHRDGGKAEINPAVENYIETYDWNKADNNYNPYPYDRWRCYILLGGSSGNGAGDYYFKVSSASAHSRFENYEYNIYMQTKTVGWQNLSDDVEAEPNGGGDCSQPNNAISLGVNMNAVNENYNNCRTDEFHLTLTANDFDAVGDTLFIYFNKRGSSGYSDMRIYGIWSASRSMDIVDEIKYQTYTDFTNMPSGRGGMTFENFKPNSTNSTKLDGFWDWPWFFYDYDQNITSTRDSLFTWTSWLWNNVGIRGLRMDAVKHFPPEFVGGLFDYLDGQGIQPQLAVGEFFDSNPVELKNWIDSVYANMSTTNITPRLFDFSLRQALKDASDLFGYDVRNVFNSGMVDAVGLSGFNSVTFVDNHDLAKEGNSIQNDPVLAYAYILTNNKVGLPTIFYPDYYSVPEFTNGGMKKEIDELMEIHKKYIFGATNIDYLSRISTPYFQDFSNGGFDNTTLFYQITGTSSGRDLLVAINYAGGTDTLNMVHGINSANINPGDVFVDLLDNAIEPFSTVDASDKINIKIPPRSYSVWIEGVTVQVKIFLEGPYNSSTGLMNTGLNSSNFLPLTSPYIQDKKTVTEISSDITDWILLQLYDDMNNPPIVSKSVFVRNDGMLVLENGTTIQIPLDAQAGDYYIVLRHRNHLAIRSANKVTISASTPLYDFTISSGQAYNNGTKNIGN